MRCLPAGLRRLDPLVRAVPSTGVILQPLALGIERGSLGAQRRQRRLQLPRRLARLLTERADVLLPQQIGQQGLDLAVAVGAELPLALGREDRREEGVRRPADALEAS